MSYFKKKKLVYELIFCRGLILNIVFHSVNDCVGGLVTVVWTSGGKGQSGLPGNPDHQGETPL